MTTIKSDNLSFDIHVPDTITDKISPETQAILDSNPSLALKETLRMVYENSSKHNRSPKEEMKKIVNDLVFDLKQMPEYQTRTIKSLKKMVKSSLLEALSGLKHRSMASTNEINNRFADEILADVDNHVMDVDI